MIDFGDAVLIVGIIGTLIGLVLIFLGLRELKRKETQPS